MANTAIIGAGVNIRISDKDPLAYFAKYGIGPDKRSQQFIQGAVEAMSRDKYAKWLNARTQVWRPLQTPISSIHEVSKGNTRGGLIPRHGGRNRILRAATAMPLDREAMLV